MNYAFQLYSSKKTIFSIDDIQKLVSFPSKDAMNKFLQRAKKDKILLNPYKGYRALPNYEPYELACKIKNKAYLSCETVLFKEGVFFQFYGNTFSCIANDSRKCQIDGKDFLYYKIKSSISDNPIGIKEYNNYRIATPERALCDYIYLNPRGVIDAPENINKDRLKQILPIYPQSTNLAIQKLINV